MPIHNFQIVDDLIGCKTGLVDQAQVPIVGSGSVALVRRLKSALLSPGFAAGRSSTLE